VPQKTIDVAVAIIINAQQQILVNQRQSDKEHAGQWEFPGGKFEENEDVSLALIRECQEELGIKISSHSPLLVLTHNYPRKTVRLHVRTVNNYIGQPNSLEQQKLAWHSLDELYNINLLPADLPILHALEAYLS